MNKNIFIKHHLGLGDAIIHNGMVRKIYEDKKCNITIASKFHNFDNVKFMYRDNPNIKIIAVNNDYEMNQHLLTNKYDEIISSHFDTGKLRYNDFFDDAFYYLVGMDPMIKKDFFYLERDSEKENEVYDELIVKNNITDYILIHEKPNENIFIDRNKIRNDLPIVFVEPKYKIFDLLKVMENATECHLISSSFLSLFTCKKYNEKVFAHMYADRLELANYVFENNIQIYR